MEAVPDPLLCSGTSVFPSLNLSAITCECGYMICRKGQGALGPVQFSPAVDPGSVEGTCPTTLHRGGLLPSKDLPLLSREPKKGPFSWNVTRGDPGDRPAHVATWTKGLLGADPGGGTPGGTSPACLLPPVPLLPWAVLPCPCRPAHLDTHCSTCKSPGGS